MNKRNKIAGNTLLEYTVCGAAIVLVCIGGISIVSGNLSEIMSQLKSDMQSKVTAAKATEVAQQEPTPAENTQPLLPTQPELPVSGINNTLTPEEISLLKSGPSTQVMTVGANGATELHAKQLQILADTLLSKNLISKEQHALLMQLANQGHKMAEIEKLLEGAASDSSADLISLRLNYDGQTPIQSKVYIHRLVMQAHVLMIC